MRVWQMVQPTRLPRFLDRRIARTMQGTRPQHPMFRLPYTL
ncbi:hypothetical protein BIFGAL_02598 [Bifidobacterium gallicum DSM 20093 = LMG 11596]|uniref:Uncharacterized protein n=1 Tax=Bifidobacterium gallicum DSM 20093 = LMG 11596 TaxID=561180 RepID=D1NS44_9BIFI|nr:hypothetical protein BIFGAL_02598 [Bifidobacterium gallicum DSM 20093 = LMG 11596]